MKKRDVLSLIRYHAEKNEAGFRNEAYKIAKDFDESGDYQLAEYIMALLSNHHFLKKLKPNRKCFFCRMLSHRISLVL